MRTTLITGANGFIGKNLVEKLVSNKIHVTALDLPGTFDKDYHHEYYQQIEVDYSNLKEFYGKVRTSPDVLFHLAWDGVKAELRNDYFYQLKNIELSMNVMEFAAGIDTKKIVMLGSASEYLNGGTVISGDSIPSPIEAYGAVKSAANVICQSYAFQKGIPFVKTIVSSLYGPGRDDNNILSYAIKCLLGREKPIFTALEQEWDFLYIDDFLEALYLIGKKGEGGKTYPIASGTSRPMAEYIEIIHNQIDSLLPLGIGEMPYKAGKPENAVFDISILARDTGFYPTHKFEDAIVNVIEYFKGLEEL